MCVQASIFPDFSVTLSDNRTNRRSRNLFGGDPTSTQFTQLFRSAITDVSWLFIMFSYIVVLLSGSREK